MNSRPIFLKLGGSLITDKTGIESPRKEILERLAREISESRIKNPGIQLVLGHGSGSFGHVAAASYGTRHGVQTGDEWRGFAEVGDSASRLNAIVRDALLRASLPVITLQPSASAKCRRGKIVSLATDPIKSALSASLIPVVHGDVAFDEVMGGTIISTEEILSYLAVELRPSWLLLAGETEGVIGNDGKVIPLITSENLEQHLPAIRGSQGTDVTGGMHSKVQSMLDLVEEMDSISVRIFSGIEEGLVLRALIQYEDSFGTVIRSERKGI